MADIRDLGRYVEAHPDDYEHRWRLAKKLYMACEYRLALEHLQILQNEWSRKLNVVRYLAATLYRVGRYDDAVREIENALEIWPDEIGLREQMARVLEVAGRSQEAAKVWDAIATMKPDHAMADTAARRLRSGSHRETVANDLHIADSDSGIDLAPKRFCHNCGAQNSAEFDRCWQCHSPFTNEDAAAGLEGEHRRPGRGGQFTMLCLLGVAGLAMFGAYVAYGDLPPGFITGTEQRLSVFGALYKSAMVSRLVLGAVLLLAWPIVLLIPLRAVPSDAPSGGIIGLTGTTMALLTFGALWAPLQLAGFMLGLLAACSLVLILGLFDITLKDTFVVWLVQLILIAAVGAATLAAVEGPMAVLQAPAAVRFAKSYDSMPATEKGEYEAPLGKVNAKFPIVWTSTGSTWLDGKLAHTEFILQTPHADPPLTMDLRDEERARVYETIDEQTYVTSYNVLAGSRYEVNVRGQSNQQGLNVGLTVRGILRPQFGDIEGDSQPAQTP